MPGDTFAVVVTVGFLVSLLMIPLSFFVLGGTTRWFILSTLVFLVAGVLGTRVEKGRVDGMGPEDEGIDTIRLDRPGGPAEEITPETILSKYQSD